MGALDELMAGLVGGGVPVGPKVAKVRKKASITPTMRSKNPQVSQAAAVAKRDKIQGPHEGTLQTGQPMDEAQQIQQLIQLATMGGLPGGSPDDDGNIIGIINDLLGQIDPSMMPSMPPDIGDKPGKIPERPNYSAKQAKLLKGKDKKAAEEELEDVDDDEDGE